jgi:hypothetical protein
LPSRDDARTVLSGTSAKTAPLSSLMRRTLPSTEARAGMARELPAGKKVPVTITD